MWRFGGVTVNDFINFNENINDWTAQVFFKTDENNSRKFFYPPSVTLEIGYDMVFMGTGDRENACCNNNNFLCSSTEPDIIAAVKDAHSTDTIVGETNIAGTLYAHDLVDVTNPSAATPNLADPNSDADGNGRNDQGWYIRLVDGSDSAVGEKVLAEGTVFYKVFYITTFTPNEDPCVPGGDAKIYALSHLTGAAGLDFDGDGTKDRSFILGGGIPSKPVTLITKTGIRLLISVGSTRPDNLSLSFDAGIENIPPVAPVINFYYRFWREF